MKRTLIIASALLFLGLGSLQAREGEAPFMTGACMRDAVSLGGTWDAIIDIFDRGEVMGFPKNLKSEGKTDFYEYSFDGGLKLKVPGDWNSQNPELKYYEGTIWYARHIFGATPKGTRRFLYFEGVSNRCKVFLNGKLIGEHEGAFLPFQIEVTDLLRSGDNFLAVEVNNRRTPEAIPALDFDWWNYGGITRDVLLVSTPSIYVKDCFFSLDRKDKSRINVSVDLSKGGQRSVCIEIPELGIQKYALVDEQGHYECSIRSPGKIEYWSPENPKLYKVRVSTAMDTFTDEVGFRTISVKGTKILLNGEPFFAKSVSFHEEIPQRMGRACTEQDARYLIGEAKALGANMVRLAHYPQNEHIVRLAQKEGIVLWEEIPLWQKIKFSDEGTLRKALEMYRAMIYRDRNRCNVCFWGLANETRPSESRNAFLEKLLEEARKLDSTRLFSIADDIAIFNKETDRVEINDPMIGKVDVLAINKYLGWYAEWDHSPQELQWNVAPDKPLIISEFGGEALYGRHGDETVASSWSEEYQAKLYRDNLTTFANIPNLAGVSPWVLFDFRSPRRFLPGLQDGWNRKGLLSDKGCRKQAWYVMHDYYLSR